MFDARVKGYNGAGPLYAHCWYTMEDSLDGGKHASRSGRIHDDTVVQRERPIATRSIHCEIGRIYWHGNGVTFTGVWRRLRRLEGAHRPADGNSSAGAPLTRHHSVLIARLVISDRE